MKQFRLGAALLALAIGTAGAGSAPADTIKPKFVHTLPGTGAFFLAMTNEKWAALPDADDTTRRDRLVAESGLTVVQLSPEQDAEWKVRIEKVAQDRAAELDGRGRGGHAQGDARGGELRPRI